MGFCTVLYINYKTNYLYITYTANVYKIIILLSFNNTTFYIASELKSIYYKDIVGVKYKSVNFPKGSKLYQILWTI